MADKKGAKKKRGRPAKNKPATQEPTIGRPPFDIDWEKVDELLEAWCDGTEIAAALGIHKETLYDACQRTFNTAFSDYKSAKRASGNSMLRKVQHDKALSGDNAMLVWLGKNRLDQTDKKQVTQDINLGSSFGDLLG